MHIPTPSAAPDPTSAVPPHGLRGNMASPNTSPCIVVHGGAWNIPQALTVRSVAGVQAAAHAGFSVLQSGGDAVDAVEAAVVALENDPAFDAGHGSCLNAVREVEMDAAIMTDDASAISFSAPSSSVTAPRAASSVRAGAVAAVSCARNPVRLARLVMQSTEHCLLVGQHADAFARRMDSVDIVDNVGELVTPEAVAEWEAFHRYDSVVTSLFNGEASGVDSARLETLQGRQKLTDRDKVQQERIQIQSGHDTVGAVAMDSTGRFAAATSTGGITNKMAGRVGDSPIIGSGAYACAEAGAVSTTGHGESIMKVALAKHALMLVEHLGMNGAEAAGMALKHMQEKTGGRGGLIVVDKNGHVGHAFTTERMAWASIEITSDGETLKSGIDE